jgi:alkylhydroperoxidase family enzyme
MGSEKVARILEDYRTAPIDEKLRATLGFLEKLTLEPDKVTALDAQPARDAGVSTEALEDAVVICSMFNVIDRMADALGFKVLKPEEFALGARFLLLFGYKAL